MDYGLVECAECSPGISYSILSCHEIEVDGKPAYLCRHHSIRYKCDFCGAVEYTARCRATHRCKQCGEVTCVGCLRDFPREGAVLHNEATDTYICRNCDAFWSCATCGRTYLNDGAILLTGRCPGCASDALAGGKQ